MPFPANFESYLAKFLIERSAHCPGGTNPIASFRSVIPRISCADERPGEVWARNRDVIRLIALINLIFQNSIDGHQKNYELDAGSTGGYLALTAKAGRST
jgi:hypothetical protein